MAKMGTMEPAGKLRSSVGASRGTARSFPPRSVPTLFSSIENSPSRSLVRTKSGLANHGALHEEEASEAFSVPVVLYVDKQRLTRDCVSEQLAVHLPEWAIESVPSARELQERGDWPCTSVVLLHTHSASVKIAEITHEIAVIVEAAPSSPLVLLSDLDNAAEVAQAIQLGVRGYLPTNLSVPQAIGAIRLVEQGGTYIPACVLAASLGTQQTLSSRPVDAEGSVIDLSPRELQVLEILQQGKQNKTIAFELGMCESTVKVHIRHIMRKINARNRTQVVLMTKHLVTDPARLIDHDR